ncbi:MAG: response regulator [Lachnospiraceae bacterium]|nr:response regulator [Lachnospiraceae bacterium]
MGNLINTGLIIFGVLGLVIGASYFTKDKLAGSVRYLILFMGIFSCIWCAGYGVMGFCENLTYAYYCRNVGLFGLLGFLTTEAMLLLSIINVLKPIRVLCSIIYIIAAISDFVVFGKPDINIFIRTADRTSYYSVQCFEREYHYAYLAVIFVTFVMMDIFWFLKKKPKRELAFEIEATVGNMLLVAMAIPDTVLPQLIDTSIPTSGIGGFICLFIIWRAANETNTFNVTINNLGQYIYESVNTAVLLFGQNGNLEMANHYAVNMLGGSVKKGNKLTDIFDVEDQDIVIKDGTATTFRAKSLEKSIECEIEATFVYDRYKEPFCIIYVIHDMTETNKLIYEANEASRAKSNFLANMSHEIRTPINAILGLNEIIMKETDDKEVIGYSKKIVSAGRSLLSIVNDVLDLSRIESGKIEISPAPYKLSVFLNECYNLISIKAYDKNLGLKIDVDESLPSGYVGDVIRIRQIVVNLLSNAVKYTPKGTVRMKVGGFTKDGIFNLKIAVMDTGIGIRADEIDRLFESFKRIDEIRNKNIEGTGLGLSIAKHLLDLMGGEISVTSVYGEGSTFTVTIPQQIENMTPIGSYSPTDMEDTGVMRVSSFEAPDAHILVVDDVDTNLVVFCGLLKKTKIKIDMASDGFEAIKLAERTEYDIIFMDHMMPEMDGVETLHKIKEDPLGINKNTPVVMLTANAIYGVKEEYLKEGFDDYISKPLRGEVLENMVRKFLEKDVHEGVVGGYADGNIPVRADSVYAGTDRYVGESKYYSVEDNKETVDGGEIVKLRRDFGEFLDIDTALMYSGDDPELFMEIAKSYLKNDLTEKLTKFYEDEDYENYRIKVHSLKSSSLNIGAIEMSKLATKMDAAIKKKDIQYVVLNNDELMKEYGRIIAGLRENIKE